MKFNDSIKINDKVNRIDHIAFIMDGNGRWATRRLLPRNAGHKQGVEVMLQIAQACFNRNIPYVSFYAFSTENCKRSREEVNGLKLLLEERLLDLCNNLKKMDVRLNIMGDPSFFSKKIQSLLSTGMQTTGMCKRGTLNLALNYGGRQEILRASACDDFESGLYTNGQPDPDILIRTGGEKRLSNFMLYQLAYTELFFIDTYWPDFSEKELDIILSEYIDRDRRFGK